MDKNTALSTVTSYDPRKTGVIGVNKFVIGSMTAQSISPRIDF